MTDRKEQISLPAESINPTNLYLYIIINNFNLISSQSHNQASIRRSENSLILFQGILNIFL